MGLDEWIPVSCYTPLTHFVAVSATLQQFWRHCRRGGHVGSQLDIVKGMNRVKNLDVALSSIVSRKYSHTSFGGRHFWFEDLCCFCVCVLREAIKTDCHMVILC